jgi:hypothetical protein
MNMENGSISTRQQGSSDNATRDLKEMFEGMIAQWWIKNNKNGGMVSNARMGAG